MYTVEQQQTKTLNQINRMKQWTVQPKLEAVYLYPRMWEAMLILVSLLCILLISYHSSSFSSSPISRSKPNVPNCLHRMFLHFSCSLVFCFITFFHYFLSFWSHAVVLSAFQIDWLMSVTTTSDISKISRPMLSRSVIFEWMNGLFSIAALAGLYKIMKNNVSK